MPELPEVETMRRGAAAVVGGRITAVARVPCPAKPITVRPRIDVFRRRVLGKAVVAVERLGKRVVLRLDSSDAIVIEPRMTGLVLLAHPPDREHLRFCVRFRGVTPRALWYWDRRGLGSVRLFTAGQLDAALGAAVLGPDALNVTLGQLRERMRAVRRAVKVALLDQRILAGVGNLYACEILHVARIHPAQRCHRLTADDWRRLHAALRSVLEEAIRYEGSTLSDGTYRNVLNAPGAYQNHHRVYGRAGEICPTCGGAAICRIVQAQRSTFFCVACQSKRGRRKTNAGR
jgi:formamidopyrimidine-DNA glycosylase